MKTTQDLINQYYTYFNQGNMDNFLELLDEDVVHDINQGESQAGKKAFEIFMDRMNACYKETVKNLVIMTSEDGKHAAARFNIEGVYKTTDAGLPQATGQQYVLPCGAFFEVNAGKIIRVSNYYNLNDWLKQVENK